MDFFGHQERARRRSAVLGVLFAAAVALIIAAVYVVVAAAVVPGGGMTGGADSQWGGRDILDRYWSPVLFAWTSGAALLLISAGALYKTTSLAAGGGEAVARMLGGDFVETGTRNHKERVLLNVVEEMALASGVGVPRVFLIDSSSINALAAGTSINGAVIGITRGALEKLSRQELQGVIAHEFSHVINGDMAGNLRLVGMLHGILLLSIVGRILVRAAGRSGGGKNSGQAKAALFAVGAGLFAIGYIGVFFGKLIKAAVARQREFLADASAVQYTRDPEGIYGALEKISEEGGAGSVDDPAAEEVAHLFFANALGGRFLDGILSSHPPVEERLKRILPLGRGRAAGGTEGGPLPPGEGAGREVPTGWGTENETVGILPALAVGLIEKEALDTSGRWLANLNPLVTEGLKTPEGSAALLLSLLVGRLPEDHRAEAQEREQGEGGYLLQRAAQFQAVVDSLPDEDILPVADLCMLSLKSLTAHELRQGRGHLESLAEISRRSGDLFSYMVNSFVRARLDEALPDGQHHRVVPGILRHLTDAKVVFSFLARQGSGGNEEEARRTYEAAARRFVGERRGRGVDEQFFAIEGEQEQGIDRFDKALFSLRSCAAATKRSLMEAVGECVFRDGVVTSPEHTLMRAIGGVLDCPVPPLPSWRTDAVRG